MVDDLAKLIFSKFRQIHCHKSLEGPRSGIIFCRKGPKPQKKGQPEDAAHDFEDKINFAVLPSLQGGPHNHQIAALAVALKQAMPPGFKAHAKQVLQPRHPGVWLRKILRRSQSSSTKQFTIALSIQKEHGKLLEDFNKGLINSKEIENLEAEVEKFAASFDMPGFEMSSMKYKD
ncbi:hypothetical protein ACLOJK_022541 [Asimina triloba]